MGELTHRQPGDRAEWDRLRQQAGFATDHDSQGTSSQTSSTDTSNENLKNNKDWIENNPEKRKALANAKDHSYNLIDDPTRDQGKEGLFGIAKNFPETTRKGYRDYLEEKLREKAEEEGHPVPSISSEEKPEDEVPSPVKDEERKKHHHRRHLFSSSDYSTVHRVRAYLHAELAEFSGVFVLMAIGTASTLQSKLGGTAYSEYTTVIIAWGVANMVAIYVAGGYSGAHLNPVVTLTLWFYRGFPFERVFTYWIAQFFGSFAATAWIFILYYPALKEKNPEGWGMTTGSYFFVAANPNVPVATAWFNEVTATAIIHIVIFAVGDSHNVSPARGMNALVLGFTVMAIGSSFGYLTAFGSNPVRDFGPRIFLSMAGFPKQMWTTRDWFWLVGEWTGPFLGGIIGAGAYDSFIFDGPESPINFPRNIKKRSLEVWLNSVSHPIRAHRRAKLDAEKHPDEPPPDRTMQNMGQPAQ